MDVYIDYLLAKLLSQPWPQIFTAINFLAMFGAGATIFICVAAGGLAGKKIRYWLRIYAKLFGQYASSMLSRYYKIGKCGEGNRLVLLR